MTATDAYAGNGMIVNHHILLLAAHSDLCSE
jgi:hypothetical protein